MYLVVIKAVIDTIRLGQVQLCTEFYDPSLFEFIQKTLTSFFFGLFTVTIACITYVPLFVILRDYQFIWKN